MTPFLFDDLYVRLVEGTSKRRGLSPKSVREVHKVLHVALKRAVKTKLIAVNPTDGCDLPRLDQKEAVALSPDQLENFQKAATGTWLNLLIRLAAAIGARRGELLACRWSDLEWSSGSIRIERSLYQVKNDVGIKATKNR
jgi:integrase